jgi:hypothetical protein
LKVDRIIAGYTCWRRVLGREAAVVAGGLKG